MVVSKCRLVPSVASYNHLNTLKWYFLKYWNLLLCQVLADPLTYTRVCLSVCLLCACVYVFVHVCARVHAYVCACHYHMYNNHL